MIRALRAGLLAAVAFLPVARIQTAQAQPVDYPALRVTAPGGAQSLLLGSIHLGYADVPLPSPQILEQARRVVIEGDPALPQPPRAGDAPPPDAGPRIRIGDILDAREMQTLRARLACRFPSEPDVFEFALRYLLNQPLRAGWDVVSPCPEPGRTGLDQWMKESAAERHVPLDTLEAVADAQAQWYALPDRIFIRGVHRSLTPQFLQDFADLLTAVRQGNYEEVCRISDASFATTEDAALFERRMLTERNLRWLPRLEPFLKEGKAVVVVGAAHLCGPTGVPALLRQRGYELQAVRVPATP
ncbi:TraB/GumN family protein [Paracraurococcus lichenis]|uniref:TraB/GumN family protein n=1 Tax=Paracraurococcus lichenis TaxID=3064888 RepID=A0ABT9ECD4_9PROT|nr:TraB/GumN family protein [Paracraurococcus sp. LOR1-02]MDO9713874.1 TraB/GumN family protein [Paracraurococcus sp. LOR1-02]